MESNGMDRVERLKWQTEGKRINWDWWRKEPKWGQNVVLGKELKLACEKRRAGKEKESGVKRQESWIQWWSEKETFLQSALLEHTRELDIQELHADTTRISLTYEKSVGTYYHSPNAEID